MYTGARERFCSGGGVQNVDMPSDSQNLGGGHRHIHPLETKGLGGGGIAPLAPPPAPAPLYVHESEYRQQKVHVYNAIWYIIYFRNDLLA